MKMVRPRPGLIKMFGTVVRLAQGLLLAAILVALTRGEAMLVPRGSVWKYHDLNQDLGTAWRQPGYPDSQWNSGPGRLGGGDPHIVTLIKMGPGGARYPTIYFRHTFEVGLAAAYERFVVRLLRDDGAAVYLKGTLLAADGVNVPSSHGQFATQTVGEDNESTYFVHPVSAATLVNGVNVLAVEVKQANPNSSDLGFDLELAGLIDEAPPELLEIDPPPGTVAQSLEFIRVIFDEGITGIDAPDLLINGQPAASLSFVSNRECTFTFPLPPTGTVQVSWAPDHGITDLSPQTNSFSGSDGTYILDPESGGKPNLIISEFLAANENGIRDEDGNRSDWIEICNLGLVDAYHSDSWSPERHQRGGVRPGAGFPLASGVYAEGSLTLSISAAPGTALRHAFDGSIPTTSSLPEGPCSR